MVSGGDTPTGFPRYGAASRRLTIVEGYGYASAQRGLCFLFVERTDFMRFILLFVCGAHCFYAVHFAF